ncbi:hypothetical protein F558DRAFT_05775, partial [Streptomyces sp. AmelKG-A3]
MEAAKSSADPCRGETSLACGPLPGSAKVLGKGPGQAELGVGG